MAEFLVQAGARRASRRQVRLGCEIVRTRDYELIGKRMIDLSADADLGAGLRVIAQDDVALGEDVQVFFRVPFSAIWVLAEGSVARIVQGHRRGDEGIEYGIRLGALHPCVTRALQHASLRFPPTWPVRPRRIDYAESVRRIAMS